MIATDLMTRDPVTIDASASVRDAARLLQSLEVRHLPVLDEEGTLVGMLSDRDLGRLAYPAFLDGDYTGKVQTGLDVTVSSLMTSDVISATTETELEDIVDLMLQYRVGAVPIVDGDGALVGIVSYVDVLREAFANEAA